ncbi:MAG: hypothetical protein AB7U95_00320 [Reyranella sp.]
MNSGRFMTAILCDDVRREEGNKLSYMGIYSSNLLVPAFPAPLAKLCFVLSVVCQGGAPPPARLVFQVFNDDNLIGELPVPDDALAAAAAAPASGPGSRVEFGAVMQVFPVMLTGPGVLKARALCDGEELAGGAWPVTQVH